MFQAPSVTRKSARRWISTVIYTRKPRPDVAKILDDPVTPIKLDMSEFENQGVLLEQNEMHIPE
jgi:hypothetical protein